MPPSEIAQKISDNPVVTALGRMAQFLTLPVITIGLWLGGNYLAGQTSSMAAVSARVAATETFDSHADTRITALETSAQLGRADRLAFQDKTEATLAKIVDQNGQLLAQVAGLTARLNAVDHSN